MIIPHFMSRFEGIRFGKSPATPVKAKKDSHTGGDKGLEKVGFCIEHSYALFRMAGNFHLKSPIDPLLKRFDNDSRAC